MSDIHLRYILASQYVGMLRALRRDLRDVSPGDATLFTLLIARGEVALDRLKPPPGWLFYVPTMDTPDVPVGMCIFCREHRRDVEGKPCASYLASHEFRSAPPAPTQSKRLDLNLCTKCKLHKKNPASATSDCKHTYPEAP